MRLVASLVAHEAATRDRLINPVKIVIFPETAEKPEKAIEMRIVEALGTLFRAIARRDGVKLAIAVEDTR